MGRTRYSRIRSTALGETIIALDFETLQEIDAVCEQFEDLLQSGQQPALQDWLPTTWQPEARGELFKNLLELDVDYRRASGSVCSADHYRSRYPAYSAVIDSVLTPSTMSNGALGPGSTLGPFEILREIGRGGMGIVFEAKQPGLDRRVALKVLPSSGLFHESTIQRFENEAKAVASLHHSNIVPLFEAGEDEGVRYYAMQLIEGRSLDQVIRELRESDSHDEAPLETLVGSSVVRATADRESDASASRPRATPRRAHAAVARIGIQVAEALVAAHRKGILHRDIKPSNLILEESGRVWVTDFGLARLADSDLTGSSDFLGTLRYMSPERFEGRGDERLDIYALGATLYEIAARRPAFPGSDQLELLDRIQKETPPPLDRLVPDLPRDLQTVIEKCLSKEPARRYRSARDLADDLQRFLESRPIQARRASLVERSVFWSRRNPAAAVLLVVLVIVAVASLFAALRFRDQSEENRQLAKSETSMRGQVQVAYAEVQRSFLGMTEARNDLRSSLYFANMNLAMSALDTQSGVRRTRELLDQWLPREDEPDLRQFEWYLLSSMAGRSEEIRRVPTSIYGLVRSPLGVFVRTVSEVLGWDARSGAEQFRFAAVPYGGMAVSGDGRWLAFGRDYATLVVDVAAGQIVATLPTDMQRPDVLSFSEDGTRLLVLNADKAKGNQIQLWDVPSGVRIHEKMTQGFKACSALSPDGQIVALGSTDGRVELRDAESFERLRTLRVGLNPRSPAFSHDGQTLAVICRDDPDLRLFDVESGRLLFDERAQRGWGLFVTFSADDRYVVSGGHDLSSFVLDRETGQTHRIYGPRHHIRAASFPPPGHPQPHLLWAGGNKGVVHAWNLDDPRPLLRHQLKGTGGNWFCLEFHPDGERLVGVHDNTGAHVLSVQTGERLEHERGSLGWAEEGRLRLELDPKGIRIREEGSQAEQLIELPNCEQLTFSGAYDVASGTIAVANAGSIWVASPRSAMPPRQIGKDLHVRHGPLVSLSPDGSQLLFAERNVLHLLDVATGEVVRSWPTPEFTHCRAAFHPTRPEFAVSCNDQNIRIWKLEEDSEPRILSGHTDLAEGLAVHPDGSRLASTSSDGTVKLWDWESGTEILTLRHDEVQVALVAWSPDGQRLATVDKVGWVRIFSAAKAYAAER